MQYDCNDLYYECNNMIMLDWCCSAWLMWCLIDDMVAMIWWQWYGGNDMVVIIWWQWYGGDDYGSDNMVVMIW